jgi:hypothetical protein
MYIINKEYYPVIIISFNSNKYDNTMIEEYKKDYVKLLISSKQNNVKLIIVYVMLDTLEVDMNIARDMYNFSQTIRKENLEAIRKICILNNNSGINALLKTFKPLNNLVESVSYKVFSKKNDLIKYINSKYNLTIFLA